MGRKSATLVSSLFIWALGIACLLSFNEWQDITIFGKNIFDSLDYLTSKLMLPLTGLGTIVFAGWIMNQERIRQELNLGQAVFACWKVLCRYVIPIAVIAILIYGFM